MDHQFTEKLQQWMNTPDSQKDWDEGAIMLLQLSGNKIMYANVSVNPKGKAEFIKGKLQQYLNFRLQNLTREEVKEMQSKVDVIVKEVIKPAEENGFADFKAGKRADHDTLPDEVKVLYAENLDIVHRMRELHLKLRTLSLENATCPDSERYPFLKELITLDKKLHENWDVYDHFVAGQPETDRPEGKVDEEGGAASADETADTAGAEATDDAEKASPETAPTEQGASSDEKPAAAPETVQKPAAPKKTGKRTNKKAAEKK